MPDITISTGDKQEERKPVEVNDIKETLRAADEYEKMKRENDLLEKEITRREELRARQLLGGKGQAGQYTPEKSAKEKADEEAAKILKQFL